MTNLHRAAAILDALADYGSLTLADLAAQTGLPRSTTHRTLQALERQCYVIRLSDQSKYVLGPALMRFGIDMYARLLGTNRNRLLRLTRSVNENVDLGVFSGSKAVIIDEITVEGRPKGMFRVGERLALHATSVGKALLSQLPATRLERCLLQPLTRFTAQTVTEPTKLRDELADVRTINVALDMEEHRTGICSIATAIRTPIGGLQAVAVVIPAHRISQKLGLALECLHRLNPEIDVLSAKRQYATRPYRG